MATQKKKRVPVPGDDRDRILVASDRTCCVCRKPGRVQIHHIDEDPANNAFDNLAVLCLTCHDDQQRRGGFSRSLSPGEIKQFCGEWLRIVARRRAEQSPQQVAAPMSRAERMRSLYEDLLEGVCTHRDYAKRLNDPALGVLPLDFREQQFKPLLDRARELISSSLPKIRVEPGSVRVCEAYESFRAHYGYYLGQTVIKVHNPSKYKMSLHMSAGFYMERDIQAIQAAIHAHIAALDRLL